MKSYFPFIKIISAALIDYLFALLANAILFIFLNIITDEEITDLLVCTYMLFLVIYKISFEYFYQQTIGKRIFNIYVVSTNENGKASIINILTRNYYLILIIAFQIYALLSYYQIFGFYSIGNFIEEYPKYILNDNDLKLYHYIIIIEIIFLGIHKGNKSLRDRLSNTKLIITSNRLGELPIAEVSE